MHTLIIVDPDPDHREMQVEPYLCSFYDKGTIRVNVLRIAIDFISSESFFRFHLLKFSFRISSYAYYTDFQDSYETC